MMQAIRSTILGGSVGYVGVPHGAELNGEKLFFMDVPRSFPSHAYNQHLTPDTLVGGLARDHLESCEFHAAAGTFHVALGPVFSDAVQEAFDEAARSIFAVLVQEAAALQTADGDGSVFASQSLSSSFESRRLL